MAAELKRRTWSASSSSWRVVSAQRYRETTSTVTTLMEINQSMWTQSNTSEKALDQTQPGSVGQNIRSRY